MMVKLKLLAVSLTILAIFAIPNKAEAQIDCKGLCYEYQNAGQWFHRLPRNISGGAWDCNSGDGCHSVWLSGSCFDLHDTCYGTLRSEEIKADVASNKTDKVRKWLKSEKSTVRLAKDKKSIQVLGCNNKVVLHKPIDDKLNHTS